MIVAKYYDMHIHLYEYEDPEAAASTPGTLLVAVSDDQASLYKTVELSHSYDNVIPCAGYHPWNLKNGGSIQEALEVARTAYRLGIHCIGEVGLDTKFLPSPTLPMQEEIFKVFLDLARELDAYVTIHSPGAWGRVLSMLVDAGVGKAMFHWYTGPLSLIDEIVAVNYYVSINPAIAIQEKHRRVAEIAPLDHMVFESDGPYVYRGVRLGPELIPRSISLVAELKGVPEEIVREVAARNSHRLLFS